MLIELPSIPDSPADTKNTISKEECLHILQKLLQNINLISPAGSYDVKVKHGVQKHFVDEGFPEENIALAESLVEDRLRLDHEFCLIPLHEVTKDMYVDVD